MWYHITSPRTSTHIWTDAKWQPMVGHDWMTGPFNINSGTDGSCTTMTEDMDADTVTIGSANCTAEKDFACVFNCPTSRHTISYSVNQLSHFHYVLGGYSYCQSHPDHHGLKLEDVGINNKAGAVEACADVGMPVAVIRNQRELLAIQSLVGSNGNKRPTCSRRILILPPPTPCLQSTFTLAGPTTAQAPAMKKISTGRTGARCLTNQSTTDLGWG